MNDAVAYRSCLPTVIILRERENTGLLESAGKFPD